MVVSGRVFIKNISYLARNLFKEPLLFSIITPRSSMAEHSAVEQSPTDGVLTQDECGSAALSPKGCRFKSGRGDILQGSNALRFTIIGVNYVSSFSNICICKRK